MVKNYPRAASLDHSPASRGLDSELACFAPISCWLAFSEAEFRTNFPALAVSYKPRQIIPRVQDKSARGFMHKCASAHTRAEPLGYSDWQIIVQSFKPFHLNVDSSRRLFEK